MDHPAIDWLQFLYEGGLYLYWEILRILFSLSAKHIYVRAAFCPDTIIASLFDDWYSALSSGTYQRVILSHIVHPMARLEDNDLLGVC